MIQLLNGDGELLFKVDYETDAPVVVFGASMFLRMDDGDYAKVEYVTLPIEKINLDE